MTGKEAEEEEAEQEEEEEVSRRRIGRIGIGALITGSGSKRRTKFSHRAEGEMAGTEAAHRSWETLTLMKPPSSSPPERGAGPLR
eukprot:2046294-Karenia_brevis.AAC.1